MTDTTATTGTGVTTPGSAMDDVVAAFDSLLNPSPDNQTDETQGNEGESAEADEAQGEGTSDEAAEGNEGAESTEDDEATEESDDATESEESEEGDDQAAPPADAQFTVRIDGKDMRVSQSELIAGYSRQSDYTRKTQALANDRKSMESEVATARQERAEYGRLLPMLRQTLEQSAGKEPDWAAIQQEDQQKGTQRFPVEWANWQRSQANIAKVRAEESRVAAAQEADAKQVKAQYIAGERTKLYEALPQWKSDPKVAKSESDMIAADLTARGFTDDELVIHDSRMLQVARDAALYRQSLAKQSKVKGDLKTKIKAAKVVTPKGAVRTDGNTARRSRDNHRATGTVASAADFIAQML